MADPQYNLEIDMPKQGMLHLELADAAGRVLAAEDLPYEGHVDNALLTWVDNLFKRNNIVKSALIAVRAGSGIDKNSSLYRIVKSFASALAASQRS